MTYPLSLVIHYGKWYSKIAPGSPVYPDVTKYYKKSFDDALAVIERALDGREFLVANKFTVADISVGYNFRLLEMMDLIDEISPELKKYWGRLNQRAAYQRIQQIEREQAIAIS